MAKCFDSDDESAVAVAPPVAPAQSVTQQQRQPSSLSKPSVLYSDDDEEAAQQPTMTAPPPAKVPQFKARVEWQPPPSQLPGGPNNAVSTASHQPSGQPPQQQSGWQPPQQQSGWQAPQQQQQPQPLGWQQAAPAPTVPPQLPNEGASQNQQQQQSWASQPPAQWAATQNVQPEVHPAHPVVSTQSQSSPPVEQNPTPVQPTPTPAVAASVASSAISRYEQQEAQHPIPAPVPFSTPALPSSSRPQSIALPHIPTQHQERLDHVPALPSPVVPPSGMSQHLQVSVDGSANASWEAFQQLRKQLDESHGRTVALHQQVSQLQLTHEKEAASFRDAANAQIEQQRKSLESTTEHYNDAQLKIESMSSLLSRKAEQIVKLEQNLHERTVAVSAMTQKVAHMDDRVRLSDSARQIAEVRCRELELTLEHSSQLVETLRKQLSGSYDDKVSAMQQQYQLFERNREQIVEYFNNREQHLVQNYNTALQCVQAIMEERMGDRENKVASHWESVMSEVKVQYERLQRDANTAREDAHQQMKDFREKMYAERDKMDVAHEKEVALLEQRHREREEHVLSDIARRERELGEREQKYRVQRAHDEQDAKVALLTKEAEMKSYYEKMMEDLRSTHEKDRDRLISTFRDQIQQLSAQHLNNERELERMHREKEREMAQRYRVAGYEVDDRKGQLDLTDVTTKTQTALLSKFDTIESRQRERAEHSRAAFRGSTSLSSVGLPPSGGGAASNSGGSPAN